MIVTVTANPAIDKRLIITGFSTGTTNRASVERVDIGGKGVNVALNLARLGCDTIATGLIGATDAHDLAAALTADGVHHDFVRVPGAVRRNLKIFDPGTGVETEINESGQPVPPEALEALTDKLRLLARRSAVMVFSGSLPPGAPDDLYAEWIRIASAAGVRTVLDTAGAALACGIAASPDLVKPNRLELEEFLHVSIENDGDLAAAGRALLERGAATAVISLGDDGALGVWPEGMWRVRTPAFVPGSTVGAGDAMVAALALAMERSLPPVEALRLAAALGSAAAASAAPLPPRGSFEALLSQVVIEAAEASAPTALPGMST